LSKSAISAFVLDFRIFIMPLEVLSTFQFYPSAIDFAAIFF